MLDDAETLQPALVEKILQQHGTRGRKAIDAVGDRRVKHYRDCTVVVGLNGKYIVEDGHCTCPNISYNLDAAADGQLCWHALAVKLAAGLDVMDTYDLWYAEVEDLP